MSIKMSVSAAKDMNKCRAISVRTTMVTEKGPEKRTLWYWRGDKNRRIREVINVKDGTVYFDDDTSIGISRFLTAIEMDEVILVGVRGYGVPVTFHPKDIIL